MTTTNVLETNFNENFLTFVNNLIEIQTEEYTTQHQKDDATDTDDFGATANKVYEEWYTLISDDPATARVCVSFYEALEPHHTLLMQRDTRLFTVHEGDLFSTLTGVPKMDTVALMAVLQADGSADNIWDVMIGLYRLAILVCLYVRMPLVKEIISVITEAKQNSDISGATSTSNTNFFGTMCSEFSSNKKLKRLVRKIMKNGGNSFEEVFQCLQRVLETLTPPPGEAGEGGEEGKGESGSGGGGSGGSGLASMLGSAAVGGEVSGVVDLVVQKLTRLAAEFGLTLSPEAARDLARLASQAEGGTNTEELRAYEAYLVSLGLTGDQCTAFRRQYTAQGLSEAYTLSMSMGATMAAMQAASHNTDEEEMKKIFTEAAKGMNMNQEQIDAAMTEFDTFDEASEEEEEEEEDTADAKNNKQAEVDGDGGETEEEQPQHRETAKSADEQEDDEEAKGDEATGDEATGDEVA
jgi:hypothetical protein